MREAANTNKGSPLLILGNGVATLSITPIPAQGVVMKSYLKGLFLFATIALVFLFSACAFASPPAEPTPNLQPTIDALEQKLAKERRLVALERESAILNVARVPTSTPFLCSPCQDFFGVLGKNTWN